MANTMLDSLKHKTTPYCIVVKKGLHMDVIATVNTLTLLMLHIKNERHTVGLGW